MQSVDVSGALPSCDLNPLVTSPGRASRSDRPKSEPLENKFPLRDLSLRPASFTERDRDGEVRLVSREDEAKFLKSPAVMAQGSDALRKSLDPFPVCSGPGCRSYLLPKLPLRQ